MFDHLTPTQARYYLRQIRPLLAELIPLLAQDFDIEQEIGLNPCEDDLSGVECTQFLIDEIRKYGIDAAMLNIDFLQSNEHRWQLLNALQTVGQQILDCLQVCSGDDTPTTPDEAFQYVFPEIQIQESGELQNQAESGVIYDATGAIVSGVIRFPNNVDYYQCVDEEDEGEKIESIDDCPEGQKAVQVYTNNSTYEGIIRHELGHIFFRMLGLESDENILETLENYISGDREDGVFKMENFSTYFPNYLLYETGSSRARNELFADIFSILGRFMGDGDFYFEGDPEPPECNPEATEEEANAAAQEAYPMENITSIICVRLSGDNPAWLVEFENGLRILVSGVSPATRIEIVVSGQDFDTAYTVPGTEILRPSDREVLGDSTGIQYFQSNFCCWLAQIMGYSSGDASYDCLCSSDK